MIALIAFPGSDEPSNPPEAKATAAAKSITDSRSQKDGPPKLSESQAASAIDGAVKPASPAKAGRDGLETGSPKDETGRFDTNEDASTEGAERVSTSPEATSEPEAVTESPTETEYAPPAGQTATPVDLNPATTEELIRDVFKEAGEKAVQVARCESELRTDAQSGQFLGLFQMGANERARYGHGQDALVQVQAAYQLYRDRGWQPWTCA
ncbi:MAG: hypothetical protein KY393_01400 [Actinobacteria bacterium]|nr:hypothetical protein [Actinomycetota bacterium]